MGYDLQIHITGTRQV